MQRALIVAALCAARFAAAQTATPAVNFGHTVPVPTAIAALRNAPIVLDGKLDENAWQAATPITEFTQSDPDEGKPASQRTEVRFLY